MKKINLILVVMIVAFYMIWNGNIFSKNTMIAKAKGVTIGAKDQSSEWWEEFGDVYQLHGDFDVTFTFDNYSDGKETYNNYSMVFSKQLQGIINPDERTDAYAEYAIIRADAYGWGYSQEGGTVANATCFGDPISYDTNIYSDGGEETFLNIMKDAFVTIRIKRIGKFINSYATMVSNKDKTKSKYVNTSFSGITEDIWFVFTTENCYLENFLYKDNTGDSIVAINEDIPTTKQTIIVDNNALSVVGKSDLSSGWWEDHTKSYLLSDDAELTFIFNHYSLENTLDGSDNFVYHFTNKAYIIDDENRENDYVEHVILYANDDGYSLEGGKVNGYYNQRYGFSYEGYPIEYTRSYQDINELKMILSAATVTTRIKRTGRMVTVNEKVISKIDSSKLYTREVVFYSTNDDMYVGFTTNGCYFEILSAPSDNLARESKILVKESDINSENNMVNNQEEKQESNDYDIYDEEVEPVIIRKTLKLKKTKVVIKKGKKVQIKAVVRPTTKIQYFSSNKKIALVNTKGVVSAKRKGKAVIFVSANGITKKFKVTVK